jgi:hypothetical protein
MMTRAAPAAATAAALREAVDRATMTEAQFCAGLREELLVHATIRFYPYVADRRAAVLSRWGDEMAGAFDVSYADRPARGAWPATRALIDQVTADCAAKVAHGLVRERALPGLAALRQQDKLLAELFDIALGRASDFDVLLDAHGATMRRLPDGAGRR